VVPSSDVGRLKAELISMGRVRVPKEIVSGYRLSRSTAGPGAGSTSLAFAWTDDDGQEHHIKLSLAKDDMEASLELIRTKEGLLELRRTDGPTLITDIRLLPIVMHAPGQAFINLDGECIYECAFCNTPLMDPRRKKLLSPQRWVELVLEAYEKGHFHALAITSVAAPDHEALMKDYEAIIEGVLERVPGMSVGVEPYIDVAGDITRLKAAGAHEIKINIQSPVHGILERICPGWSLERQFELLAKAVEVFGRGKVTTNIILGLGETDEDVEQALEHLASMGVVPTLRAVRINDLNRPRLESALGHRLEPMSPERHIRLAMALKGTLEKYDLTTMSFETMCHKCGCCDLEPGVDV
jgi:MoaA/NifB/PqqE/SkfB family radical SAM enzyme